MGKPQLGHDQVVSEYRWSQEQVSLYSVFQVVCHEGKLNKQKPHLNATKCYALANSPIVDRPAGQKFFLPMFEHCQLVNVYLSSLSKPSFMTSNLKYTVQGFAESLQQECSKPAQNVMIELYCCGPGLLFWLLLFQIRKGLGPWVFKVLLQRFCKTLYHSSLLW